MIEYEETWSTLGDRPIEALIDLPLLSDLATLATLDVLIKLSLPALYTDANLFSLVSCRAVSLSLKNDNCDASSLAYAALAFAGPRFGDSRPDFDSGSSAMIWLKSEGRSAGCLLMDQLRQRRDFIWSAVNRIRDQSSQVFASESNSDWFGLSAA